MYGENEKILKVKAAAATRKEEQKDWMLGDV